MATFVCRVQFLDDTDPFNSTNFPEPTRPPVYTFREDIPLINQIAGVHRLLKAPQKVGKPVQVWANRTAENLRRWVAVGAQYAGGMAFVCVDV
uniref:FHOD1 N-terminal GTPase-binding domain-containing protein n=1 Tax=Erpetoichthys calabaricus TaxID=27687 RepID=A0A8C4SLA9_ERPCA